MKGKGTLFLTPASKSKPAGIPPNHGKLLTLTQPYLTHQNKHQNMG